LSLEPDTSAEFMNYQGYIYKARFISLSHSSQAYMIHGLQLILRSR